MDIPALGTNPNVDGLVSDISKLGLERHVLELEVYGFTVLPPELTGSRPGFIEELRDAICRVHGERNDDPIGDPSRDRIRTFANNWALLEEDDVFVESVTNPVVLTLVGWMCGLSAVLSGSAYIIKAATRSKNPDAGYMALHNDTHGVPPPLTETAHWLNTSWLTTDYEGVEDGPTVLVPGSHRLGHIPQEHERRFWKEDAMHRVVPLVARAGSLAVWHGATWHGSTPRTREGLRVTLVLTWARNYMKPANDHRDLISTALLERFPDLHKILGLDAMYPFGPEGAPADSSERMIQAGNDPFA